MRALGVTLANARGASIASRDDDAAPGGSNFGWMFRRRARIAATAPRCLRPCCAEPSGKCAEDIAIGTCRGQIDADAGCALYHARRDLDQTNADRGELRSGYQRALRSGIAHAKHEPIGGGVQDQAELVGLPTPVASRTSRTLSPSSCVSRSTSRIFLIDILILAIGSPCCSSQGLPIY